MRSYSRTSEQMRPIRMTPNYTGNATGSVLIEYGETKVICTVMVEDGVPGFLRSAQPPQGWLTAEYSMLPGATGTRSKRDRQTVSGRTQEIQRLIGRSIRGVFDLTAFQDLTFHIDCDVIQADGGTRTASITGAYVALKIAVQKLMRQGKLKRNPLKGGLAAVSSASTSMLDPSGKRVLYVSANKAVMRDGPTESAKIIKKLRKGDHFLFSVEGEWAKTDEGGYVSMKNLSEKGVGRKKSKPKWK